MRIYYRGPDAIVTSELFIRCGSPPGRFAIGDLRQVGIAPGAEEVARPAVIVSAAAAALVAAAAVSAAGGVLVALTILVVASVAGGVTGLIRCRKPRRLELRATYRGRETTLYSSTDERVFNQVSRALRRALEDHRWERPAAA
ncbi:DUF6232 family protein [Paractinoplanes rishiriensis]|uniref:Uncharacterized protein n=1 Tax=Paractinoplanes rishiriensis TaxID=1050105 RepID=A0A919MZG5_9ACTN|nr:DUF6232 family protein [Actinoplanes rishiriensis]GIE98285.1 hypothetical protein Ari01nite_57500 [Actinoplanes rishiriensis]